MFKLMKYEFRKTFAQKLILLGITAVLEIAYLIALFCHNENWTAVFAGLLTLLAIGGVLMIGLGSVLILHRDINTKQSYMLFMTPNSSYRILGAKVAENGLSILLTGVFFFALGALDVTLLFTQFGTLADLWDAIQELLRVFNQQIPLDTASIALFVFSLLASWFAAINAAYLADVISASLLNGKKYNGLLTFVVYLGLAFVLGWLQRAAVYLIIGEPAGLLAGASSMDMNMAMGRIMFGREMMNESVQEVSEFVAYVQHQQLIQGIVALVYAGILYVCTAELMERKLSV